ncbi:MAG TPA: sigma-70 family RNA polymerase sigma factor [Blastocatellia bacterium]|nr:sigma-70 family RNA polymerase sigma factor [Blastocatellia bacterium]
MTKPSPGEITQLLIDWSRGDQTALDQLMPLVYDELRRLAHRYMRRERPGHTLQTTALVNEVYIRLIDQTKANWQNRVQFLAVCAMLMRRILVTYAQRRRSAKREGQTLLVSLDEAAVVSKARAAEVIALDEALMSLEAIDPRKSRIVELRFFGGLTIEETAEALHVSHATVEREWNTARAWLYCEMTQGGMSEGLPRGV